MFSRDGAGGFKPHVAAPELQNTGFEPREKEKIADKKTDGQKDKKTKNVFFSGILEKTKRQKDRWTSEQK